MQTYWRRRSLRSDPASERRFLSKIIIQTLISPLKATSAAIFLLDAHGSGVLYQEPQSKETASQHCWLLASV